MPLEPISRRHALRAGAGAGLAAVLGGPVAAAAAAVDPRALRTRTLNLGPSAFADAGRTAVLAAPARFSLLGASGAGAPAAGLEVRARRRGGPFGPWVPLGAAHAPDAPRGAVDTTDPVWTGAADELQLRTRRRPGALRLHLVSVPAAHRHHGARARAAAGARGAQLAGAPPIVPRAVWGADAVPPRAAPLYGDVQLAFVHHTVTANGYAPADSAAIVLAIAKYHRDTNGWNDIGYNLLVDQYGQIFEGRAGGLDAAVVGAHAQGWNSHSTGIATLGTFEAVAFPEAGLAALARVIAWKLALHGVPVLGTVEVVSAGGADNRYPSGQVVTFQRVSGHRDGCATACPGAVLYGQLDALRSRAAAIVPPTAPPPSLTLAAAAPEVPYGQPALVSGRAATPDGTGVAGLAVDVEKQGPSGAYTTVARTVTAPDGSWSAEVAWRRSAALRAAATTPGGAVVRSAPVTVALQPSLTVASPARSRIHSGRRAVLQGAVSPAAPVSMRVERQLAGGAWGLVGFGRAVVRGGRFRATRRLTRPGLYRLTARSGTTAAAPVLVRVTSR